MGNDKDIYRRVNFLFQAAKLVLKQDPTNHKLCQYYISTMRTVAEKHVLRMHPDMKRSFCKNCNVILLSGNTCRVRARSKCEPHTVVTCLLCGNIKRFMWRKSYQLWLDKPEAWLSEKKYKWKTKKGEKSKNMPKSKNDLTDKPKNGKLNENLDEKS